MNKLSGYGGIGRRARFRFWWATVQVQVLLSAPDNPNLNTGKRALHFFEKVVAVVVRFKK